MIQVELSTWSSRASENEFASCSLGACTRSGCRVERGAPQTDSRMAEWAQQDCVFPVPNARCNQACLLPSSQIDCRQGSTRHVQMWQGL